MSESTKSYFVRDAKYKLVVNISLSSVPYKPAPHQVIEVNHQTNKCRILSRYSGTPSSLLRKGGWISVFECNPAAIEAHPGIKPVKFEL